MYPVPILPVWCKIHPSHGPQVVGLAASFQRHRRHDVPMASCSATVPVLYCTPTWKRWSLTQMVSHALRPDCPPAVLLHDDTDQPFDSVSTGSSEDADLVPVQSGEDWIARLDDDLSQPAAISTCSQNSAPCGIIATICQ